MNTIDYQNIADSQKFYTERGYNNIEIPWYVTKEVMNITKPKNIPDSAALLCNKKLKYVV
jgi:flagellar basal body L-ring protein FlgH